MGEGESIPVSTWYTRIVLSISLLLMIMIIIRERKRAKRKQSQIQKNNKYHKWLNRLTLLTLLLNTGCLLFGILHKIPFICVYNYALPLLAMKLSYAALTIYQIIRLQYCFSSKQKYGYPKYVFILLYLYGILLMIILCGGAYFTIDVQTIGIYGCVIDSTRITNFSNGVALAGYLIWDWTVLLLYFVKYRQIGKLTKGFRRKQNERKSSNFINYHKINYTLKKILILTSVYELKTVTYYAILVFTSSTYVNVTGSVVDALFNSIILYLMREHNDDEWKYLIRKTIICSFCNYISHEMNDDKERVQSNEKRTSKTTTTATFTTMTIESVDATNFDNGINHTKDTATVVVPSKDKEVTPLCISCGGFYHIQSDPCDAYDGVGIVCDLCGRNRQENAEMVLESYYYKCESCQNTDICSKCYKLEKTKLIKQESDDAIINEMIKQTTN